LEWLYFLLILSRSLKMQKYTLNTTLIYKLSEMGFCTYRSIIARHSLGFYAHPLEINLKPDIDY
jgi:hypothetical protein